MPMLHNKLAGPAKRCGTSGINSNFPASTLGASDESHRQSNLRFRLCHNVKVIDAVNPPAIGYSGERTRKTPPEPPRSWFKEVLTGLLNPHPWFF
jgi:hypothetical protein